MSTSDRRALRLAATRLREQAEIGPSLLTLRIYDGDDTVYLNTAQARAVRAYIDKVLPNE